MNKNILLLGLVTFYAQNAIANDLERLAETYFSINALQKGVPNKNNVTVPENPFKHTSEDNRRRADELRKAKQRGK